MGQKISVPQRIHRAAKLNDISELQVRKLPPGQGLLDQP